MELSQEEKDRIEAEERHREAVRRQVQDEAKQAEIGPGIIGAIIIFLFVVGIAMQIQEGARRMQVEATSNQMLRDAGVPGW